MCLTCGCNGEPSKVELIKEASRALRGTIAEDLARDTPTFADPNVHVLKFHGVYQQEDRDRRKEARRLGLDRHYQMMVRTRIPGGRVSPEASPAAGGGRAASPPAARGRRGRRRPRPTRVPP